ncbi:MAG: hypothetical protein JW827_01765 [Spirochaetes bacterium]|nr:hypothetical protein [Spirochaetota bacterium]
MKLIPRLFLFLISLRQKISFFLEKKVYTLYLKIKGKCFGCHVQIGKNVRIGRGKWYMTPGAEIRIEDNVIIRPYYQVLLKKNARLIICRDTYIGPYAEIYLMSKLQIGRGTYVAQHCTFIDYNHKFDGNGVSSKELRKNPIRIGDRCWLCVNVVISAGSVIGDKSLIGPNMAVRGKVKKGSRLTK